MQPVALPVVSAITAGVLIIGQMGLMLAVALRRRAAGVALGGDDPALLRLVRRHGNYAENAAIFVASLALLEMMGAVRPFVIGLAALFIAGRLAARDRPFAGEHGQRLAHRRGLRHRRRGPRGGRAAGDARDRPPVADGRRRPR